MRIALVQRRWVWWPTMWGWAIVGILPVLGALWWCRCAEGFLALTQVEAGAELLVVEGWIGMEGLERAKDEFNRGGYGALVAAGGLTTSRWSVTRASYAEMAQRELVRLGVPEDRIVVAGCGDTRRGRTFAMAEGVRAEMQKRGMRAEVVNVFTHGVHARRSRLVYAKVLRNTAVGCLAWEPEEERGRHWWQSSERAKDLINETAGYLFELFANSGRGWVPQSD